MSERRRGVDHRRATASDPVVCSTAMGATSAAGSMDSGGQWAVPAKRDSLGALARDAKEGPAPGDHGGTEKPPPRHGAQRSSVARRMVRHPFEGIPNGRKSAKDVRTTRVGLRPLARLGRSSGTSSHARRVDVGSMPRPVHPAEGEAAGVGEHLRAAALGLDDVTLIRSRRPLRAPRAASASRDSPC
jgi:hypothetical protein